MATYDQSWFEMSEYRRRRLDRAAWIPLRVAHTILTHGKYGELGHVEEFFGAGSVAVPLERRAEAERLGWMDVGIRHDHRPYVINDIYRSADQFLGREEDPLGVNLVMNPSVSGPERPDWIVHPDLILGFRLIREEDSWLSPDEGYEKVIDLQRNSEGSCVQLLIRAEHLKDYLSASGRALYVTSFRSRREIVADPAFRWKDGEDRDVSDNIRWEGRIIEIHEGGTPFGGKTAVIHTAHADFDSGEDVPILPHPVEGKFDSDSWVFEDPRPKLFVVSGELWREEWVKPGEISLRLREDDTRSTASFIVDASGTRRLGHELRDEGRWLWFRPDVVQAIAHRRGGTLQWYTRDTGGVGCVPTSPVHFGLNRSGLVTIYAKDIACLPDWQQRIWAAYNVTPDGGVSEELQAAQVRGSPSRTQAPEAFLIATLDALRELSEQRYGSAVVRSHQELLRIVERCHRFRATDSQGLFALAKDLARVTADLLDAEVLNSIVGLEGKEKRGSLKAMEAVVASIIGAPAARKMLGPLFGIYDLRLGSV